jgi:hypothetical protein
MKKKYSTKRMEKICFWTSGHIKSTGINSVPEPLSLTNSISLLKSKNQYYSDHSYFTKKHLLTLFKEVI